MKVVFATPSISGPMQPFIDSMKKSIKLIKEAGWSELMVQEVGCPYISHARATMTRKAMDAGMDVIVYLDYDLSWRPKDLLTLLQTEGEVVAGTYRFKADEEKYMGRFELDAFGNPLLLENKCISAVEVPAGFLKITKKALEKFANAYPHLIYGDKLSPCIDLFNHGAYNGTWYGEDYAFCRNWRDCGGKITLVPDLTITHWAKDKEGKLIAYPGNIHQFALKKAKEAYQNSIKG